MVDHINESRSAHIVTIEDPIEVLHQDKASLINQREIGIDTKNFAEALRRALRQDPDVVFIGEIRDAETVQVALSAAETGHLVLSTLHTINAAETINRIIDFFPLSQQRQVRTALAATLRGVVSQRLLPRADGLGRVPSVEVLVMNGRVFDRMVEHETTDGIEEIMREGEYYGMQTFDQSLLKLCQDGTISIRDALMVASHPHDLRISLQQLGLSLPA
jgi:twitching motility protein PilT